MVQVIYAVAGSILRLNAGQDATRTSHFLRDNGPFLTVNVMKSISRVVMSMSSDTFSVSIRAISPSHGIQSAG